MAFSSSASSNVIFAPPNIGHLNKKDQCVLSWINATLSDKVLASAYGITSAREVWSSLANKFALIQNPCTPPKAKVADLHQGSMKCIDFLEKTKLVSDELAAVGKPLEDDDLMSYINIAIPPETNNFAFFTPNPTNSSTIATQKPKSSSTNQLAAMVAHSNAEQEEETWFADSGANQHITANLEHLTLQQTIHRTRKCSCW
ncbi:hypothetical protein CK203_035617 [Vitis vinifera]|uniref:Retrovirus-related Pol polyprotein from transposon RE1 n=1 Tax=Vitis vinifera TaxID=29760 RepID=A0A438HPH5_VITVI|nr:hypothetical protein CK203_035617 [Vitis vinifera]